MPHQPQNLPSPEPASLRRHRERGATIAEVVIAATLLTFVVLGALGSISRSLSLTNQARMVTLSSQVLQSAVEDLRLRNYSVIQAYAAQPQPVDLTSTITSDMLASSFTNTMSLSASFTTVHPSSTTELGLTAVDFTVTWRDGAVTFRRSARTSFSEKGLSDYIYVGF